jgi:hypothetical protein
LDGFCPRARELYSRTDRWDQFNMPVTEEQRRRILCLADQISKPGIDDRYLTRRTVDMFDRYPQMKDPEYRRPWQELLPKDVVQLRLKRTDRDIWRYMQIIDQDILDGRKWLYSLYERQQSAVQGHARQMMNWVVQQQNNDRSIYWCYRP